MGLKDDLIKAKVECFKIMGKSEDEIDSSVGSALEVEANLMTEAIVNFLTSCQFRITGLVAPVVLEDFNIPPQQGDVLPSVQALGANGGGPVTTNVTNGTNGVLTKAIDVGKDVGGLESTGYVYIGGDPDSQGEFDVSDLDGIRTFTSVELFREDIEDLL
tara:strand:+ start:352 stop:831 length:480 start_codon:yes stop_codon:yes gene_type:complete